VDKYKTTKLDNYSEIPMNVLLNRLMRNVDRWRKTDFDIVRQRWTELAMCINTPVKYRGEIAQLVGINENGALILRNDSRYILVYGDEINS
jgi:biotin-(acetyl-CoA carboxylase) ligase